MIFFGSYLTQAGKSTLMNILFGMDVIHSTGGFTGDVLFEGKQVKIMKPSDPEGRLGPKKNLPDIITVHEPKEYPVPAWKPNQPVEKVSEEKEM